MTQQDRDIELVRRARDGDQAALNQLLQRYTQRLRRMVMLRMNDQLRGRLDASDVVQDAYVEASRVLEQYLEDPSLPFFLWLRHLTSQKLIQAHRRHLGAQGRSVNREVSLQQGPWPQATSASIAAHLVGKLTSPSQAARRAESRQLLQAALEDLQPIDREVLVLRHFEQLSGPEAALVLGITHEAVKKRYLRALERLGDVLRQK